MPCQSLGFYGKPCRISPSPDEAIQLHLHTAMLAVSGLGEMGSSVGVVDPWYDNATSHSIVTRTKQELARLFPLLLPANTPLPEWLQAFGIGLTPPILSPVTFPVGALILSCHQSSSFLCPSAFPTAIEAKITYMKTPTVASSPKLTFAAPICPT